MKRRLYKKWLKRPLNKRLAAKFCDLGMFSRPVPVARIDTTRKLTVDEYVRAMNIIAEKAVRSAEKRFKYLAIHQTAKELSDITLGDMINIDYAPYVEENFKPIKQ